jgi:hypothetical protein
MLFAAALARQYSDETTASIYVRGLMNHRLVDDLADKPLMLGNIRPAHQDVARSDFNGSPGEFEERKLEWAADSIAQCLRALNYPATMAVASAATSNCTRRGHFKMYQPERCKVRRSLV